MDPLIEEISSQISELYPDVKFSCNSRKILEIPRVDDNGFEILVQNDGRDYIMQFGNWYFHFDNDVDGKNELLYYLGFGMSKAGRLQAFSRGGKEYKWRFEMKNFDNDQWYPVGTTRIFNLNFWEKPTLRTFQNDLIQVIPKPIWLK